MSHSTDICILALLDTWGGHGVNREINTPRDLLFDESSPQPSTSDSLVMITSILSGSSAPMPTSGQRIVETTACSARHEVRDQESGMIGMSGFQGLRFSLFCGAQLVQPIHLRLYPAQKSDAVASRAHVACCRSAGH
jgi:hypothetical protein